MSKTLFILITLSSLAIIASGCSTPRPARKSIYQSLGLGSRSLSSEEGDSAKDAKDAAAADADAASEGSSQEELLKRANESFSKEKDYWLHRAFDDYKAFVASFPQSKAAPLALYRIGYIQFKFRNCNTCDSRPVYDAINSFRRILQEYPASSFEADARTEIRACREILAENSNRIGVEAIGRKKYLSAISRFQEALEFARDGVRVDPAHGTESMQGAEALYRLGKTYEEMGRFKEAKETYLMLNNEFPRNDRRLEVEEILAHLAIEQQDSQ